MPREAEPSANERAFMLQALQENIRMDGRTVEVAQPLDYYRPLQICFGNEFGTADVQLGKTRVLARASAHVTVPYPDRQFDGIFNISIELSPLASPAIEVGRSASLESTLTHHLDITLRRSSALPTESLCLLASRAVWTLQLTIHVLSHDGSLLTAASIAALGALAHFRLPATSVQGEQVTVFTAAEREPVPLTLLHWPLCVSMWFFAGKGREMVLLDATLREEQVCNGEIVVTANAQGEICQVKKLGGPPADALLLLQCVDTAVKVVKEHLARKLREALDKDTQARDKGGVMTAALSAENER